MSGSIYIQFNLTQVSLVPALHDCERAHVCVCVCVCVHAHSSSGIISLAVIKYPGKTVKVKERGFILAHNSMFIIHDGMEVKMVGY